MTADSPKTGPLTVSMLIAQLKEILEAEGDLPIYTFDGEWIKTFANYSVTEVPAHGKYPHRVEIG